MEGRKNGWREEEWTKEKEKQGRKKGGCMYVCSCVYNCKTEHATVGLLSLFFISLFSFFFFLAVPFFL